MVEYQTPRSLYTSQLSPPAPALPIPAHTSPPTLLSLLPSPFSHTILISIPCLLPIASLRGTFAPGGCSLRIHHTSFSLPSSHAVLLPSSAIPLYLDSPIGYVLPSHIPNTLLAALFPRRSAPHFLPPSSCTLYLAEVQTCCLLPLTFSFSPLVSPSAYNGGPGGRTIHTCNICGRLFSLSLSQCIPGYRVL